MKDFGHNRALNYRINAKANYAYPHGSEADRYYRNNPKEAIKRGDKLNDRYQGWKTDRFKTHILEPQWTKKEQREAEIKGISKKGE